MAMRAGAEEVAEGFARTRGAAAAATAVESLLARKLEPAEQAT
jgi:hypothetical protein